MTEVEKTKSILEKITPDEAMFLMQKGSQNVSLHNEPSEKTMEFMQKIDVTIAENNKDIKYIIKGLEENKQDHRDLKSAQEYTNGKVRSLFLWKATIVGMGIVLSSFSWWAINDYVGTKEKINTMNNEISTIQGYFINK